MSYGGGTMAGGPLAPAVGDIDGLPGLEVLASSFTNGPLYAWRCDGSIVPGFPTFAGMFGFHFPTVAVNNGVGRAFTNVQGPPSSGHSGLLNSNGTMMVGWPRTSGNYLSTPPSVADLDFDGVDEILRGSENRMLDVFRWNGSNFPAFPKFIGGGGQGVSTPFIADLNQDSYPDVFVGGGSGFHAYQGPNYGFHPNYPVTITESLGIEAIADLDGDDLPELIGMTSSSQVAKLVIYNRFGQEIHRKVLENLQNQDFNWNRVGVADVTGDDIPEIILVCDEGVRIVDRFGENLPGWPRLLGNDDRRASMPMIGDVDGDSLPDIVFQANIDSGPTSELRVYDRFGNLHPSTPKLFPSFGKTHCAIADIDLDGRNDIIVYALPSAGFSVQPQIWAYDLNANSSGLIHWGQIFGNAKHVGYYIPPHSSTPARSLSIVSGTLLSGSVESTRLRDSSALVVRPNYNVPRGAPVIVLEIEGYTLDASARELGLVLEGNTRVGGQQINVELWDWTGNRWVPVSSFLSTGVNSKVESVTSDNVQRFLLGHTRKLRGRISVFDSGNAARWDLTADRVRLMMTRR